MDARPVVVLGAYGEAGSAVVRALAATKAFEVVAAGRDAAKLAALQRTGDGLSTLQLDVFDAQALAAALRTAGLVINCVGPYVRSGLLLARAAVEAKVAYLDLASEQEHARQLRALDSSARQAGTPVLTGVGAYPGLSGILLQALLRRHPGAQSVELALVTGAHADPALGAAQAVSGVMELAFPLTELEDGRLVEVVPGERRSFDFPQPFGPTAVMRWPQLEVLSLAAAGRVRDASTFVALGGEALPARTLLRLLRRLRPTPGSRVLAAVTRLLAARRRRQKPHRPAETTNRGAIVVVLREGDEVHTASASVQDVAAATSWLPVYAAKRWAEGGLAPGVAIPLEVFQPQRVIDELRADPSGATFSLQGV